MHPLLDRKSWLGFYLVAWIPLTAILVVVLVFRGELSWEQGSLIGLPLGLTYALLGMPVFFVCRANPLRRSRVSQTLGAHLLASVVYGVLWLAISRLAGAALENARLRANESEGRPQDGVKEEENA